MRRHGALKFIIAAEVVCRWPRSREDASRAIARGAWPAGSLRPGSIGNSNHETTFMTTLETLNMSVFKKRNLEQTASGLVVLGSFLKHERTQTRNEAIDYYKPSETNLKFTDS